MLNRYHLLKLEDRRKGHPNKPAPKIRPFVVVPKDTPTVYKSSSSVSSGSSFSSRKHDFGESIPPLNVATPSKAPSKRIPITIPVHKPLTSSANPKRESFRVRPSLDRQPTDRTSFLSRASLDSAPVVTGQKRRLEEVLMQERDTTTQENTRMEIDSQNSNLHSLHSPTSQTASFYSKHEASSYRSLITENVEESVSTYRSLVTEKVQELVTSKEIGSSIGNTVADSQSIRSPSVHDEPVNYLERHPSPHSSHLSPVASPSSSSTRSFSARKSISIASETNERRSPSIQPAASSPVAQFEVHDVIPDVDADNDENETEEEAIIATEENVEKKDTFTEETHKSQTPIAPQDATKGDNNDTRNEETAVENEDNIEMEHDNEQEAHGEKRTSQTSVSHEADEEVLPEKIVDTNSRESSVRQEEQHENSTYQNDFSNEGLEDAFRIDLEDDIDYTDYNNPEGDDIQSNTLEEFSDDVAEEEIVTRARDIEDSFDIKMLRLTAYKLGTLHVDALHQLTMEVARSMRNTNSDPYVRSVIEDYTSKLNGNYDKCHTDYNEYLTITQSLEKLEKLAKTVRSEEGAIEIKRLQLQRTIKKSNKEVEKLDEKINKLEKIDDFWITFRNSNSSTPN